MFINYKKLAEKLNSELKDKVVEKVAENISKKILENKEFVEDIARDLTVKNEQYSNYFNRFEVIETSLTDYVALNVANKLIPEVYDLNRAEVLKEVHTKGVLNIINDKLQDQAKQHVLDFITKPINRNNF